MIVRIFGEDQYRLDDSLSDQLHELDAQVQQAVDADDEAGFADRYGRLLELVRSNGERLAEDELSGSDLILPPADLTLAEAKREFSEHGLIPD